MSDPETTDDSDVFCSDCGMKPSETSDGRHRCYRGMGSYEDIRNPEPDTQTTKLFTPSQRHVMRYLARWETMFGKPRTMDKLRERGLVEQCGEYNRLPMWRLTAAGKEAAP